MPIFTFRSPMTALKSSAAASGRPRRERRTGCLAWSIATVVFACGSHAAVAGESGSPDPGLFAERLRRSVQIEPSRVRVERDVMVPMRDGIRLATDIYLPKRPQSTAVGGRYPAILARTPYDKA